MSVHVESYHVDNRSGPTTDYLPDGTTFDCRFDLPLYRGPALPLPSLPGA